MSRVELDNFLKRFMPLVRNDMLSHGSALSMRSEGGPFAILADTRALHQVLLNLIRNAADAMCDPEPRIVIGVEGRGNEVELSVTDNGCGMTEEQQAHLFKPFHSNKITGTGLGLVITQRLVAQMNGTLTISSEPGTGTRVVMSFEQTTTT